MKRTLCDLSCGGCATVEALTAVGDMRARLTDLGFCPGSRVCCVARSPLGDPVAYRVCGAVIALRRRDARTVMIGP